MNSEFKLVLVRWTRKRLPGEEILDFLDESMRVHASRNKGEFLLNNTPVIYIKKPDSKPFEIKRNHRLPVLGCVDLDDSNLAEEIRRVVH